MKILNWWKYSDYNVLTLKSTGFLNHNNFFKDAYMQKWKKKVVRKKTYSQVRNYWGYFKIHSEPSKDEAYSNNEFFIQIWVYQTK